MSKGWKIAIVIALAVAVAGALSLKALKGREAGRAADGRRAATSGIARDTGRSAQPKNAQPPSEASKEITKPASAPEPARKTAGSVKPTAAPQPTQAAKPKSLPKLLDLGATKCIPCKMMAPILEELAKEYEGRLVVEFIDVWESPDRGKEYGVKYIPTQIFYDENGEEFFRHVGFYPKEDILAQFEEHGIRLAD
ncbi:MAG TPA: thioredoxin domain-containing protein [Armatimonadota bacterium]|nr:thioredoxin domain-containing protein [Armatimonadota bacterium]